MEIYRYESIEEVNHGINKLEAMGWCIEDVDIKVFPIYERVGECAKTTAFKEMFYVFVEKANFGETLEKSSIPTKKYEDDL